VSSEKRRHSRRCPELHSAVIVQGSQIGIGTYFLKYSREDEREADLLGVQIMARAGYDPRDMANMFQTIARRSGNGGPE
jgi:predicted Zn-dependent protease